jgi:hypothetical protein
MNWQYFAVIVLIALATGYLLRQHWRAVTGRKDGGCGGGCSCPSKAAPSVNGTESPNLIAPEQITLRRRNIGSP